MVPSREHGPDRRSGPSCPPRLFCVPTGGNGDLQFDRWPDPIGRWHTCPLPMLPSPAFPPLPAAGPEGGPGIPDRAAALVSALADDVGGEFALFGHESAALVAYEMAVELDRRGLPAPCRLFVSGSPAPQHAGTAGPADPADRSPWNEGGEGDEEGDDEVTERVLAAVLATQGNPLPVVVAAGVRAARADVAALREYAVGTPVRLRSPLTVIDWSGLHVPPDELAGWAACGEVDVVRLAGSRLRYATDPAELIRVIARYSATPA